MNTQLRNPQKKKRTILLIEWDMGMDLSNHFTMALKKTILGEIGRLDPSRTTNLFIIIKIIFICLWYIQ